VEAALVAVEASGIAQTMRRSVWLYPLANVLHVLAAMAFFAAVAAMDVKVLRSTSTIEARAFIARLRPVAIVMLGLQIVTGVMLFLPEATHVAANPIFQLKLAVILMALLNVALLEFAVRRSLPSGAPRSAGLVAAGASLVLWLGVAALGRLIAYF
jgi:hypothetical protein